MLFTPSEHFMLQKAHYIIPTTVDTKVGQQYLKPYGVFSRNWMAMLVSPCKTDACNAGIDIRHWIQ